MGTPSIQSHQASIEVFKAGEKIVISTITGFNVNQDANFQRSKYVGNPVGEGDTIMDGWSGSFDLEVKGPEVDELIEAITTQNYNGFGIDDIAIVETEKYRDGRTAVWLHQGVQLKMSKTVPQNAKVTKRVDFQSDFRKKI